MTTTIGATEYVQPIVVLRSGTHEDAVRAVALASVLAWVNTAMRKDSNPEAMPGVANWQPWLAGRFAKSVRRAKAGQFAALVPHASSVVECGDAKAAAFAPTTYPDMDPAIAKLQVSGTDFVRSQWQANDGHGPLVLVNEGLGMSTGKTAAQAAHGLFRWFLNLDSNERDNWIAGRCPFALMGVSGQAFEKGTEHAAVVIRDAGFTEIAPGSATVTVMD